ncbi:MAG: peptidase M29 [Alphaproteobacteria bacterium]|nr:peptidase M29 [Alphaproteobacteria bacterium]
MREDRIEPKWIELFADVFALSGIGPGEPVVILSETQSRPINVALAEHALAKLGAQFCFLTLPTPPVNAPVPIRSTGASAAIQGNQPALAALKASRAVVDLTVEGILHAPELPEILSTGARVLMVSNEHPEALERLRPRPALEAKVREGMRRLKSAARMHVTSAAGSDLKIDLRGARPGGTWGFTRKPGTVAHWPGGLCLCFPAAGCVNGRLVLAPGDINLTFKRYLETAVTLDIVDDHVVRISGSGLDAALMESYFAAWGDKAAYATSHVGWGMNPAARWDALALYDKAQTNGTEQRAFAGNFLYSTGANEVAGRHTLGHFDLPMRGCTVALDGTPVVVDGKLSAELS